jgi:hypothetical protein
VMSESLGRGPRNTVAEPKAVVSTPIIQPTQIVKTRSETSDST